MPSPTLGSMPDLHGHRPLEGLLATMHAELVALQRLSTDAQLVMSFALREAVLDPGQWSRAQSLDLISQRLEGLATIASALAGSIPPSWTVDAAAVVRDVSLSDLADRLLCRAPRDQPVEAVELF